MTTTHPELDTTNDNFRECDGIMRRMMWNQISIGNQMAISGRRVEGLKCGIVMPVAHGYKVTVELAGNDTYVVRRLFVRGYKVFLHGEAREVSCERLSEVAYFASSYASYSADEWITKA